VLKVDQAEEANLIVSGWWPRFRPGFGSLGGLDVHVDGTLLERLSGYGPRTLRLRLPHGHHNLKILELSRHPSTLYEKDLEIAESRIVIQYRSSHRRFGVGRVVAADLRVDEESPGGRS